MSTGVRSRPRTSTTPPVTVPVHDRFKERARRIRRRPWRVVGWVVAVVALVVAVVGVLLWSPAFVVEDVVVEGVEGPIAEGAATSAAVPLGLPLARVDTEAVSARVEEDLRIAEAVVERDWPSTVVVQLRLREPALVLDQAGVGQRQVVDAGGVVYDSVADRPRDVPVVRATRGEVSQESLAGVLAMLEAVDPETAEDVTGLQLTGDGDLRFRLGGLTVLWGGPQEAEIKGPVLEALLMQEQITPQTEQSIVLDLAVPQTPVVTGLEPTAEQGWTP
jgi:cell division protein FtsQ